MKKISVDNKEFSNIIINLKEPHKCLSIYNVPKEYISELSKICLDSHKGIEFDKENLTITCSSKNDYKKLSKEIPERFLYRDFSKLDENEMLDIIIDTKYFITIKVSYIPNLIQLCTKNNSEFNGKTNSILCSTVNDFFEILKAIPEKFLCENFSTR